MLCGLAGCSDFTAKLCGGYILARTSAHSVTIVPEKGWNDKTPIIFPKVIEVGHDKRFIVAKRNVMKQRNPDQTITSYDRITNYGMELDPGVFDYWILDTAAPIAYGPLTWEEYTDKRSELGIPDSVVLKDVYEYR